MLLHREQAIARLDPIPPPRHSGVRCSKVAMSPGALSPLAGAIIRVGRRHQWQFGFAAWSSRLSRPLSPRRTEGRVLRLAVRLRLDAILFAFTFTFTLPMSEHSAAGRAFPVRLGVPAGLDNQGASQEA